MTGWSDGYVSDIAYTNGVFMEQMPAHLDVALLAAGMAPPVEPGTPFTYCELGCGLGDTALSVAAAYGDARVWGFDFNPAHIADAAQRAARSGLDNILLAEHAFEDLAAGSVALPQFDYVTMHGVWTWVSAAARGHVVAFLRRYLRPGGVFYVTYNPMPAWTPMLALQHLLFQGGRAAGGASGHRIAEAIGLARRVAAVGESSLSQESLKRVEKFLAEGQVSYLSHEFLNEHWQPAFFADVVEALAPAKLSYVASASLLENFPAFCMTTEQRAFVDRLSPELRQTVQDYFCPRSFRRDIFVRGPRALPQRVRDRRLRDQGLALAVPAAAASLKLDVPAGEATLNAAFYGPALARLGRGNASVGQLVAEADPAEVPVVEEIAALLIGGKQVVQVVREADPTARARARRHNRAQAEVAVETGRSHGWLAGACIGTTIRVGVFDLLAYEAILDEEEATGAEIAAGSAAAVLGRIEALCRARSVALRRRPGAEGAALPDAATASGGPEAAALESEDLGASVREILVDHLPIWRRLGLL